VAPAEVDSALGPSVATDPTAGAPGVLAGLELAGGAGDESGEGAGEGAGDGTSDAVGDGTGEGVGGGTWEGVGVGTGGGVGEASGLAAGFADVGLRQACRGGQGSADTGMLPATMSQTETAAAEPKTLNLPQITLFAS